MELGQAVLLYVAGRPPHVDHAGSAELDTAAAQSKAKVTVVIAERAGCFPNTNFFEFFFGFLLSKSKIQGKFFHFAKLA